MYAGFKNTLIIEAQTDAGRTIRDVLKELGAKDSAITSSVRDAWTFMQSSDELPDWIIAFPDKDQKFNILHLMNLLVTNKDFVNTRVSLVLSDDELDFLPVAFDLGLLSYHKKPFTKASLKGEFETMFSNLHVDRNQHYKISTEYLRVFFNELERFENRIKFEQGLIKQFPQATNYYLTLAEAQILAGKNDEARRTLGIAKHLGADLSLGIKQLNDLLEPTESHQEFTVAELFEIKDCMIVDPDETFAKHIESSLASIGVTDLKIFSDGDSAMNNIKENGPPKLLVCEWKIPKLSGAAFVQRLRQAGHIDLPIIVCSALVKDKDKNLLREIGATAVLSKPLPAEHLVSQIVQSFQNDKSSASANNAERKIRQYLQNGHTKEAEKTYAEFKKLTGVPAATRLVVEATVLFYQGNFAKARDLALEALKIKGDAVIVLNLLSKIFLKTNDRESALKCLNRAQEFSSDNLERLVLMAETYADSGDADKAIESIDAAKKVDATSDFVRQAEAEVSITLGNSENAKSIISQMDSTTSLIANMNNRAVLLVSSGEAKKGIDLYINALQSLPENMQTEKDILQYNMSLAYARLNKAVEAKKVLETLIKSSKNKVMVEKATALAGRVEQAIKSKASIKLNLVQEKKENTFKSDGLKPISLHLLPGQMCLHGIYDAAEYFTPEMSEILKTIPIFTKQKVAVGAR